MAEKLLNYYTDAAKMGGMKAEMRLTVLTSISRVNAGKESDSSENIKVFEKAMQEIQKEFYQTEGG